MATSSKRPEQVAWVSLVLSLIFFGVAFFLGQWSGFLAVSAVAWQILGGAIIWLAGLAQSRRTALEKTHRTALRLELRPGNT